MPRPLQRCPRCRFPPEFCLCPAIPRLAAPFRLVVVRHASERERMSNTARWAALALDGAEILEHALPGVALDETLLRAPGAVALFPSPRPGDGAVPATPPPILVVPDGTWTQARRMMQRLPALQRLPRLSLPGPPAGLRLRRPPWPDGMSTLEAIAGALAAFGAGDASARLLALHDAGVERVLRLKGTWDADSAAAVARRRATEVS
ncbi:DTW domain-containing protein [Anaeromyxobacter soli]|uniref:DTW domain-containing protein n=1 Tax=Anaeromyxobacter soli TaxID=2922725 RepID=UPI001FAF5338|nr:tRNA-uridine aminocarboxypropyltransferase [Anaeromyxobacter sp. SG29]